MGSPHRTLEMKGLLVLLLFAGVNGAPGVVYPQHLVYNPLFGTYAQPITYYYYYPQSRNVPETVSGRWWLSCSGPATGPDGYQCCLQDEGDCDSDSDCCEGLYCEQSWGNDYCAPKSTELPVPTETPQVNFPTETQQPASNVMEWPYEKKQLLLQSMDAALPGFKDGVQMDPSLRFDTFMKKYLTRNDECCADEWGDGNGKLSAEEMFESQNRSTFKEIQEKIERFDTDGDQQLTIEECKPLMREALDEKFVEMDVNGDHIISLAEFVKSDLGKGDHQFTMNMVFIVESWLPESKRNTASDWLALDHQEFEAIMMSMAIFVLDQQESTNTEMQAQIVGYSNFPILSSKLIMQAAKDAMKKNGNVF